MTPNADLATLRGTVSAYQDVISLPDVDRHMDAADRVEAELARLTQERDEVQGYWLERVMGQINRAEAAERELARLQEGLRPESLARLFHETYERLAPDHGYKTREDSAVLWEDVPAANRALMIATADAVARALLAENHTAAPNQAPVPGPNPKETEQSASSPQPSQQPPSSPSPAPQRRNRAT